LSLIPGEGGIRRFIGTGELTFGRKGSTLAQGKLFARGNVTPVPAIEADLELASAAYFCRGSPATLPARPGCG